MPKGYGSGGRSYSGAKTKGTNDSWRNKKGGAGHKATNVPQAGKKKISGAKVKAGYAC